MNRYSIIAAAAVALAGATQLFAATAFDGTWRDDTTTAQPSTKPSVRTFANGRYLCSTCLPVVDVPADGKFHAVVGQPYYDEMSVAVIDANSIRMVSRKGGKTMGEQTIALAADGRTATRTFNDTSAQNGVAVTGTAVEARTAAGPAGSHALSGSWIGTNKSQVSAAGTTYTMKVDGDMLAFKMATGEAFTARIDGPEAPVSGDPGWTSVKIARGGPNTLIETDYRNGTPLSQLTMTVAADGKSMRIESKDLRRDKVSLITAMKQ